MRYGKDYLKEVNARMKSAPADFMDRWAVEIFLADGITPGAFNDPDIEETCRALDDASQWGRMPFDRKLLIAKLSIVGKVVKVFYGDQQVGPGFVMTKADQSFDLFPELKENPPALTRLIDAAVSAVMGKSVPPQTDARPAAGQTREPGRSSPGSGG